MDTPLPPPQTVLELLPDAVCIVNADGLFMFVNAAFERILGYAPSDVLGRRAFDFLHPEDLPATMRQVDQIMAGQIQRHFRNRYLHKEGHYVDMQWSARWHPELGVRIAVGREVTELRRVECALEHRADHDYLTGLPNRHYLLRELHRVLDHAHACGTGVAVLYMDLDGFKGVNDRYGHEAGDMLLREAAARMRASVRAEDIAARLGGDEFIIVLPGCSDAPEAQRRAELVRTQLRQPFCLPAGQVLLDASIGVAIFPLDGMDPSSLLAHADRNMYATKRHHHEKPNPL